MGDAEQVAVRIESDIRSIEAGVWDSMAGGTDPATANPFVSHAFLAALEESGSVAPETGWAPQHLVLEDAAGQPLACMPSYLKSHSQGEYVFDHGWANAFENAGGAYYPKLQTSVPFTPVTGPRLLIPQCDDRDLRERLLLSAGLRLLEHHQASSWHLTFLTEHEWESLGDHGFLKRTDQQYHWRNEGYETFDDFLGSLASRKRKAIRRERRDAQTQDVDFVWLTGNDITEAHWDRFFDFYLDTGARKWGTPYLNREFFSLLGQSMGDSILMVMCRQDGVDIAGALHIVGGDTLYGRYWGCVENLPFLHFEACYYQAIDYAIANKIGWVEAGAQGQHKLARGYLPETTYSAHFIANPSLRDAVANYLERERAYVDLESEALRAHSPFRKNSESDDKES